MVTTSRMRVAATALILLAVAGCDGSDDPAAAGASSARTAPMSSAAAGATPLGAAPAPITTATTTTPAAAAPATTPPATADPPATSTPPAVRQSGRLAGKTVVLDPGHNGGNGSHPAQINRLVDAGGIRKACNTTGTATNSGYTEHALTWAVAQQAAADLRAMGATVVLTRPGDSGVGPCIDIRAATANTAHADATVSIHADGAAPGGRGFHVIAPALAPDKGNAAILTSSSALATALRDGFAAASGQPFSTYVGRSALVQRADLGGLNLARVPAVFIEMGNMRNATDAGLMQTPAWRARAGQGIADGIAAFLGA